MEKIKKGDIVGRISYNNDIIFIVTKIINVKKRKKIAILKGLTERIEADSYLEDLCIIPKDRIEKNLRNLDNKLERRIDQNKTYTKHIFKDTRINRTNEKLVFGKILHLDGDKRYSEKSTKYYKKVGLNAIVKNIPENKQSKVVYKLLQYYKPDILVITGHERIY